MATRHVVRTGEGISSIAEHYGFRAGTLWDLPENASLRELRRRPNTLVPGDEVHIPDKRDKEESVATGKVHVFKKRGVPARYRLQLFRFGTPREILPFKFIAGEKVVKGVTDEDGLLDVPVSPLARKAVLVLCPDSDAEETIDIELGQLHPVSTIKGAQQRLGNLGQFDGRVSGELDKPTVSALRLFQARNEIPATGELDEQTVSTLEQIHDTDDTYEE